MTILKFFPFTFWIMLLFDEVGFRDAELSRIWKSDYRIRIHRAHESSSQVETKKTISPAEMPLSIAVIYKMGIFSKIS